MTNGVGTQQQDPAKSRSGTRDWRIDAVRGLALFFLLVNHTGLNQPLNILTHGRLGFVTGAEMFVLVSGFLLGIIHRKRIDRDSWTSSSIHLLKRARKLYLAAVAVGLVVYAMTFIPGINTESVTLDRARQIDYYDNGGALEMLLRIVTLNVTPWPINILALYIMLLIASPVFTYLLMRKWGTAVLIAACVLMWGLVQAGLNPQIPIQSHSPFPVWAWQLLFVVGMAAGWHRARLGALFQSTAGRVVIAVAFAGAAAFIVGQILAEGSTFYPFDRAELQFGRVVNVLIVVPVLYVLLGALPQVLQKLFRILFERVGSVSLYVFIVQVPLLVVVGTVVANVNADSAALNAALVLSMLIAVWLMVRNRVLFRIIPT